MPSDLANLADPRHLLLAWAAGLALSGAFVTRLRVVGPGFTWLVGGTAALIAIGGVLSVGRVPGWLGVLALVAAIIAARSPNWASLLFGLGAIGLLASGADLGGGLASITVALALGGVTGEMLLGHWYLVDPRLPRSALRALAAAGVAGLLADAATLAVLGGFESGGALTAYWALVALSVLLMAGVLAALRYPAYSGVMASTGLSYLATLTALGASFLGRALVGGANPFST